VNERDLDDYESRQAEMEFVGLNDDWIEELLGGRDRPSDEITYGGLPNPAVRLALKFRARCAGCGAPMAAGDDAVVQKRETRWIAFHPEHVQMPVRPEASLEPGERLFELRFAQPCGRCQKPMLTGEQAAGRKLERGWAVRHVDCRNAAPG
jgi:hypothetical protein